MSKKSNISSTHTKNSQTCSSIRCKTKEWEMDQSQSKHNHNPAFFNTQLKISRITKSDDAFTSILSHQSKSKYQSKWKKFVIPQIQQKSDKFKKQNWKNKSRIQTQATSKTCHCKPTIINNCETDMGHILLKQQAQYIRNKLLELFKKNVFQNKKL